MDAENNPSELKATIVASPGSQHGQDASMTIHIDPEMERKVMRKFDMLVLPQFVIIMLLAYLDRTNIGMPPLIMAGPKHTLAEGAR